MIARFDGNSACHGGVGQERTSRQRPFRRERRQETFDQVSGHKTLSSHLGTREYRRLLPPNRDHARLIRLGTAGVQVEIPEWSKFLATYD